MEKVNRKTMVMTCILVCAMISVLLSFNIYSVISAATPTTGTDENGNVWSYDKDTKTLTFSGNKPIAKNYSLDGHSSEPTWYAWEDKTEHLVIKDGITEIGAGAFYDFTSLKILHLSDTVKRINSMSFKNCWRLKECRLSSSLHSIGYGAFSNCGFTEISIPSSVKKIENDVFSDSKNLRKIILPDSIESIGTYVFSDCKELSRIMLSKQLKKIPDSAFIGCKKLRKITIPSRVTVITLSAFSDTGIRNLVLPQNIREIKKGKPIMTNNTVFQPNKALRRITIQSKKITKISKGAFSGLKKSVVIRVPKSKKAKYKKLLKGNGQFTFSSF